MKQSERVLWIDAAKFLGIFAIYIGHLGTVAGGIYIFVWHYHVPLFFFLSGCMDYYDREKNYWKYLCKKLKSIMVPFWCFALLALTLVTICYGFNLSLFANNLVLIAKGCIRNTFFVESLWFLSCLFLVQILFKLFKKLEKFTGRLYSGILLLICSVMFYIAENVIIPRPIEEPHGLYNWDSMFYYIIFYAIGYVAYPYILKLFKLDSMVKTVIFAAGGAICLTYSAFLFFGVDYLSPHINKLPLIGTLTPIVKALITIVGNLVIAKGLCRVKLLCEIGQNTLFLCGNEFFIKHSIVLVLNVLGVGFVLTTPQHCYIYTAVLLLLNTKIIIPIEKKVIECAKKLAIKKYA